MVRLVEKMQQSGAKAGFVPGVGKGPLVAHGIWEAEGTDNLFGVLRGRNK